MPPRSTPVTSTVNRAPLPATFPLTRRLSFSLTDFCFGVSVSNKETSSDDANVPCRRLGLSGVFVWMIVLILALSGHPEHALCSLALVNCDFYLWASIIPSKSVKGCTLLPGFTYLADSVDVCFPTRVARVGIE